ncbi:MAG: hypothetical protein GX862_05835 [Leucobacter sp.]|nr:hypothetical protein [Leucobacter sp.]
MACAVIHRLLLRAIVTGGLTAMSQEEKFVPRLISIRRLLLSSLLLGVVAGSMSGCTISTSLTVAPTQVAEAAATALEETVGVRPKMDCGDEAIELAEAKTIVCLLTDPSTGTQFDSMVTFREVAGGDFKVDVEVSSAPKR